MVPHTAVDNTLALLLPLLEKGDTVIDGGNSYFKDTLRRVDEVASYGIQYMDAGVSGGPEGARHGACTMIGGEKDVFEKYESLFKDISAPDAYSYLGKCGAGHFVKMVHNGIEYGMMQAIAEGFSILRASDFVLDLKEVARIYNNRSVIESRLVGWLESGFDAYGTDLEAISGEVSHSGEGQWTVETAKEIGVPVRVIEESLQFREDSKGNPSYTGQVVSHYR